MSEKKEYISSQEEGGNVRISEDVIATIAAVSAAEVEGCSLSTNLGSDIAEMLGRKSVSKGGVKVRMTEEDVTVDVAIVVRYGSPIQEVAKQVQDSVYSGLEAMAGLKVAAVNVHVVGVAFPKEPKEPKELKKRAE